MNIGEPFARRKAEFSEVGQAGEPARLSGHLINLAASGAVARLVRGQ